MKAELSYIHYAVVAVFQSADFQHLWNFCFGTLRRRLRLGDKLTTIYSKTVTLPQSVLSLTIAEEKHWFPQYSHVFHHHHNQSNQSAMLNIKMTREKQKSVRTTYPRIFSVNQLPKAYIHTTNQIIIVVFIPVITANLATLENQALEGETAGAEM